MQLPSGIGLSSLLALCLFVTTAATAQVPAPRAVPEDMGLFIPDGTPIPGSDRRVVIQVDDQPEVAKVELECGNRFIVKLPDGRMTSERIDAVSLTERPFAPATAEDLKTALQARFPGFKVGKTRRYLYVYNTSEAFYKATSRILETMYPALFAFTKRQKISVHDPETLLVVVMFKSADEFQAYRRMPDGVAAYYNVVSNRVLLYENSQLGESLPELARKRSISTIAHEGVHQILHNIGVQQRLADWPMWISEGLADYFAPTDVGKRLRWKGVGHTNNLRMRELVKFFDQQQQSSLGIREIVRSPSLDSLGYAKSWGLVHFLSKRHRKDFYAYLRAVSGLQPWAEPPAPGALFEQHFGDDYERLEQELIEHLRGIDYVDPMANQTYYVLAYEEGGRRTVMVTASQEQVRKVEKETRGRFSMKAFPNKAAAQQFASGVLRGR